MKKPMRRRGMERNEGTKGVSMPDGGKQQLTGKGKKSGKTGQRARLAQTLRKLGD